MARKQTGFTMIELIVVIVILGILAATALPKFIDLRDDAITSAAGGVARELQGAMTMNFAGCSANKQQVADGKCVAVSNCSQGAGLLLAGALPTGAVIYNIVPAPIGSGTAGANSVTAVCSLTATQGSKVVTVSFTGISAGL